MSDGRSRRRRRGDDGPREERGSAEAEARAGVEPGSETGENGEGKSVEDWATTEEAIAAEAAAEGALAGEAAEHAERLLGELEELRDRHLRLAAEFENYRKRTRHELLTTRELAQADLAGRLVDALDDLRRVAEAPADVTTVQALHEGVELVERKLAKELGEAGLETVDPLGERFDPTLHEAVGTVPAERPEDDERIERVLARGYRFGSRLLRPARVVVMTHRGGNSGAAAGGDSGAAAGDAAEETGGDRRGGEDTGG